MDLPIKNGDFPLSITGWWFGTCMDYDFPYIGNVIIPTDELIFIRGVGYTTNKDNKDEDMINLNTDR